MNSTAQSSFEGSGHIYIGASCAGGSIWVRGDFQITDLSGGAVTIVRDDRASDVWDEILTGATHNIATSAGRRLRNLSVSAYGDGAIWIDTVNGTPGTDDYEHGTTDNPVDNIADATTLAASVGLARFRIAPGSSITLAQAYTNFEFKGIGWELDLNGQALDQAHIYGATVLGLATSATNIEFHDCEMETVTAR